MPDDERLRVPGEQLHWACSCGNYMAKTPGSLLGVAAHQRKTRCGGSNIAVLPEDFVVADEMDVEPAWAADAEAALGGEPEAPAAGVPPDGTTPPPQGRGPVAQGRVLSATDAGPTQFRGPATAPAGLYAVYDAFRTQLGLEGSFDAWLVELAELWLEEHGFQHVLTQAVA